MNWDVWEERYGRIVDRLGLDREADRRAAEVLNDLVAETEVSDLEDVVRGRECIVFGAGPSLEEDLNALSEAGWLGKVLISADGATSAVMEHEVPDVVVTDLDGDVDDQLEAWRRGAWLVVHGHGDNIGKVRDFVPRLGERVLGTTQVESFGSLHNVGGFTDGDRSAFLARELAASRIYLAGMDLGEDIGEFSGDFDEEEKLIKLGICRDLLSWLGEMSHVIVNITSGGEEIPHVPREEIPEEET